MFDQLVNDRCGIPISADKVTIIDSPHHFYELILSRCEKAKERIALSSLYLGDGELEKKLVSTIKSNIENSSSKLGVTVLLDFLRGTRDTSNEKSSTTLLRQIANKANIYLYHTPDLSGLVKKILPERSNEIVGLQHMKVYIFDDSVLISGANLSDSYFTNRQDRYVLFEDCKALADFFSSLIDTVGSCSFVLQADGSIHLHSECEHHPFQSPKEYVRSFRAKVDETLKRLRSHNYEHTVADCDTMVYPIIQMGRYGIHEEYNLLKNIFARKDCSLALFLASGYFNCIHDYERLMFNEGTYSLDIITASPRANGFFGASGASGYIPALYSNVADNFIKQISYNKRTSVRLYEYAREGWTFHAKGLWMESPNESATIVGSSNYGYRSVHRDLEAQVLLTTTNVDLRSRLKEERQRLFDFSSLLDETALRRVDHHIPTVVRIVSRFIRNFF